MVFLGKIFQKVPFFEDSGSYPKIVEYTVDGIMYQ